MKISYFCENIKIMGRIIPKKSESSSILDPILQHGIVVFNIDMPDETESHQIVSTYPLQNATLFLV